MAEGVLLSGESVERDSNVGIERVIFKGCHDEASIVFNFPSAMLESHSDGESPGIENLDPLILVVDWPSCTSLFLLEQHEFSQRCLIFVMSTVWLECSKQLLEVDVAVQEDFLPIRTAEWGFCVL